MREADIVWNYFIDYEKIGNAYGVAGLMGNLEVESGLNPACLQYSGCKKLNTTGAIYTENVDSGKYSKTKFCYDKFGYGIAQWTFNSRKKHLYEFAKDTKRSIGDICMQTEFLWKEIQTYPSVLLALKNAKSVKDASNIFMIKFEKPSDQSDEAKKKRERAGLDIFTKMLLPNFQYNEKVYVKVTAKSVNIRVGPGKRFKTIAYGYNGEIFELIDQDKENGWYKILYVGDNPDSIEYAWVTDRYTKILED